MDGAVRRARNFAESDALSGRLIAATANVTVLIDECGPDQFLVPLASGRDRHVGFRPGLSDSVVVRLINPSSR